MSHTPGPWHVEFCVNVICADGKQWDDRDIAEAAQNARLFAAAPDLLAALETATVALDDWLHQYAPEFCGEPYVSETKKRIRAGGGTLAYVATIQEAIHAAIVKAKDPE